MVLAERCEPDAKPRDRAILILLVQQRGVNGPFHLPRRRVAIGEVALHSEVLQGVLVIGKHKHLL
jgi:hypothetical protein